MKLEVVKQGEVSVCFPAGRLDLSQSLSFEKQLHEMIGGGTSKLIFDLSKLDYLSSSGVRVFIALIKQIREKNGRIVFCSLTVPISNLLEMLALQNDLEIYPTLFEALLSFEAGKSP